MSSTSTYNLAQHAHYAMLEAAAVEAKRQWIAEYKKARNAHLEMFLSADAVCLLKTKKHLKVQNDILGSLPKESKSKDLKRRHNDIPSVIPSKTSRFNASAQPFIPSTQSSPTQFNLSAPEFIPKSTSSSGSSTPTTPSPSISPNPVSGGYVFNIGVVNAPKPGFHTEKLHFDGDSFAISVIEKSTSRTPSPPRKIKVFSPEELQKQSRIVDEMRMKFANVL